MGFFEDLFKKAAPQVLQSVAPKITQALPQQLQSMANPEQLASMAKSVGSSLSSIGGSSSSGFAGRVSDADIRNKLNITPEQYYNSTGEERARMDKVLMPSSGGFFGDLFTDDPNKGWWDTMQNKNAQDAENARYENDRMEDAPPPAERESGGYMDSMGQTFSSALKKVATPQYLSGGANILAGVIGQNQAKKGMEQQMGAYDQALAKVQDAQQISGDAFNAMSDNPEQLAMRAQAMKGLSDRASMGLTPEDQAALQGINRQAAQQFKANNATIGQDMARRGMANSGLGLAQSMGAADQALQNQALAGQNQAAQSFAAKQGALTNLAGASNTALQSDYSRQLGKATNLSAVNQFNASQKNNANQLAANTMIGKGGVQAQAAAQKGQATGAIGQAVGGIINPADAEAKKKQTITIG